MASTGSRSAYFSPASLAHHEHRIGQITQAPGNSKLGAVFVRGTSVSLYIALKANSLSRRLDDDNDGTTKAGNSLSSTL